MLTSGAYSTGLASTVSNNKIKPLATAHSGDVYIINDPIDDAAGSGKEIEQVKISANSTGVLISLVGNVTGGGDFVFIDTDPGQGTGNANPKNMWSRRVNFTGGFGAEFALAEWEQKIPVLWNSTPKVVDDATQLTQYGYDIDAPSETKYYFFGWDLLYPSSVPAFAELGIVALVVGGDNTNVYDTVPNQDGVPPATDSEEVLLNDYIFVNVTDTSTGALAATPGVGYVGLEFSNLTDGAAQGNLTAGNPLVMNFNTWIHDNGNTGGSVNDHSNTSSVLDFEYIIERTGANTTYNAKDHKVFGSPLGGGGSDNQEVRIGASQFQDGDQVWWNATVNSYYESPDGLSYDGGASRLTEGMFYVTPLPKLEVNFVGGASPAGGFVAPATDMVVSVLVNFRFVDNTANNFNTIPAGNPPVNATISWRGNNTGDWTNDTMEWDSFENQNNKYTYNLGKFVSGNVSYFITAYVFDSNNDNSTENHLATDTFTVLIGIEPDRLSDFSITDEADDLSLLLPTGPASPWDEEAGLIDIVKFEVLSNQYNVEFRLTFTGLTNGFGSGAGYSVVIFSIYVDSATGGPTSTMWNERVTTQTGWEWALKADGFVPEIFDGSDTSAPMGGSGITTNGDTTTNVASVVIPASVIGAPADSWKYYVMAGSDDFNAYRQAGADHGGDWQLGGGEAGEIDPNVADILVPSGGDATLQEFLLGSYDTAGATLAEILPVGVNEAFTADSVDPTATIAVAQAGTAVADGATLTTTGTSVDLDLTISIADTDTSILSGLDKVEVFDGNVLVQSFTGLDGLTDELTLTVTLEAGTHILKVNVFDNTGNFGSAEFTVTVESTAASSTSSSKKKDSDDGFLPIALTPVLIALMSIAFVATYKRRSN